jgi:nucleoside phosphorylase
VKIAWTILLISALTDFVINAGTALTAAMLATGSAQIPSDAVLILSAIGGAISAARTIQQALKSTGVTVAALHGDPPPRV